MVNDSLSLCLQVLGNHNSSLSGTVAWSRLSRPTYSGYYGTDDTRGSQELPEVSAARHWGEQQVAGCTCTCVCTRVFVKSSCKGRWEVQHASLTLALFPKLLGAAVVCLRCQPSCPPVGPFTCTGSAGKAAEPYGPVLYFKLGVSLCGLAGFGPFHMLHFYPILFSSPLPLILKVVALSLLNHILGTNRSLQNIGLALNSFLACKH